MLLFLKHVSCVMFGRLCCVLLCCVSSASADEPTEFFEKHVRPLLVKRCYKCHSGTKTSGGLSLGTSAGWQSGGESGTAIVPGKPDESLLIDAINYRSLKMPPVDAGGKLSGDEIAVLTQWVQIGAPDPRRSSDSIGGMTPQQAATWWAFQPLPQPENHTTAGQIDGFVQKGITQRSLSTAAAADRRTLIRRATYDLTGLPPTPDDVDAFLTDDSPKAFESVIDRLLESPQYGTRWGRHWLDVVRYADTAGENTDRPLPHAWRYRNWVLDSFNRDLPFDEFVRQQIAGDIVAENISAADRTAGIVATGYLAVARRFGHDIDKDIHLMHEDVIDNVGKNFLGLTLGCARCHDHKYDPVTAADYYSLYGIFSSTKFSFPGCEPQGQPRDLVPLMDKTAAETLMTEYQQRVTEYESITQASPQETQRLKILAEEKSQLLAASAVDEGQSVSLHENRAEKLDRISLRKSEVLQLTVLPNANHGADTTRVELNITRLNDQESWNVADLIPKFTAGGPAVKDRGATWCFLDVADGPKFLPQKKDTVNNESSLSGWADGDTPSMLVNASDAPVNVWTTLPGRSFFVHPGHQRNVGLAWVCPADGMYQVRGLVADGHPAPGLDGVSFRFEHFPSADLGAGLMSLGELASKEKPPRPAPPVIPVAYAVVEAESKNARLQERGDPEQLGDEIPRRWLSVFGGRPISIDGGSGRRDLAEWIVQHPLFARVMVNRIWQWHFGRGIVATPNDFGSRGEAPTHPELLDWLAGQFRAGGYRIKPLHRLIMLSDAYQRSNSADGASSSTDPENHWLSRFSRRRLSAEEIRDSLLVASGQLDLNVGKAHPFPPEAEWNYTQHGPFNAVYETNLRSVFLMVQRQRRHPYLALFDGADPNSSTAARQSTTVPTQALYFLNDPFFHQQSAAFATWIESQTEGSDRIQQTFRRLLQRQPTPDERSIAEQFLAQYPGDPHDRWSAYARVLLASNEFLYVD